MSEAHWVEIQETSADVKRCPKWGRRACLIDGEVFLPAAIIGNEDDVFMCMAFDGIGYIQDRKHVYAPVSWMKRERPEYRESLENAERRVRECVANDREA